MFSKWRTFKAIFSIFKISVFAINFNPAWEFFLTYSAIFHTLYYTTLSYISILSLPINLDNRRN